MKREIAKKLKSCKKIAVTCHLRPDGDCIGTALGLMHSLTLMGKEVSIFNIDPTPTFLSKLPGAEKIKIGKIPDGFDCAVFVETSGLERSGQDPPSTFTIHIDHHRTSEEFARLNWIEPDRSSVGEMVFELFLENGFPIDKKCATCLYAAIFSDTGGFRFSNTTPKVLKYSSLLAQAGAIPSYVSKLLLESHKKEEIFLLRKILGTVIFNGSGKIVAAFIMRSFLREFSLNLSDIETESIMNILRSIADIEVILLFKELDKGFRISLRGKGMVDVGKVAELFKGGGHPQAAGFNIELGKEEAIKKIFSKIEEIFPWVKKQE